MPDADAEKAIQLLRTELERERNRVALLEARSATESDRKVLAQTRVNIGELAKALAAYGVLDA